MTVPIEGRIFWPGTVASIPANWSRDTDFDDRYIQSISSGGLPGTNGGDTTHTHAGDHSHAAFGHSHTIVGGTASGASINDVDNGTVTTATGTTHTHASVNSSIGTITYQNAVFSLSSTTAQHPFMRMIVLKPASSVLTIPALAICFVDASPPSGFSVCDGTGGTPSLADTYFLGAAVGADGGATGGASTHTHTYSSHLHVPDTHTHPDTTSGSSGSANAKRNAAPPDELLALNHHNVPLNSATGASVGNTSTDGGGTTAAESNEPFFIKMVPAQNTGSAALPDGVIIAYIGSEHKAQNLYGWLYCDGTNGTQDIRQKQIKCTTSVGAVGVTGGNITHHHTFDHGHTHSSSHNHTVGAVTLVNKGSIGSDAVPAGRVDALGHTHTWTIGTTTPTLANGGESSYNDVRYNYREVAFIKRLAGTTTVHINGNTLIKGSTIIK